ncbi:hypothetical protein L195_g002487, partial [Trifolium pratense]
RLELGSPCVQRVKEFNISQLVLAMEGIRPQSGGRISG